MRRFKYYEPVYIGHGDHIVEEVIVTEDEIIAQYWPYWQAQMISKFGENHSEITRDNCIEDFVVVHWAEEEKPHDSTKPNLPN